MRHSVRINEMEWSLIIRLGLEQDSDVFVHLLLCFIKSVTAVFQKKHQRK